MEASAEEAIRERIAAQKTLDGRRKSDVIRDVRKDVLEVAQRMKLVLHGGNALRAVLGERIDDEERDLTDMDFMSGVFNEKKSTHAFKNLLEKKGVTGLRCHPALHQGTYTLRKDNVVIADISRITDEEMKLLGRVTAFEKRAFAEIPKSPSIGTLKTVPLTYMKMSMHMELSRPAVFIERWLKVYPRLRALYARHPDSKAFGVYKAWKDIPVPPEDEDTIRRVCRENSDDFIVVGEAAAHAIMSGDESYRIEDIVVTSDANAARARFPDGWVWVKVDGNMFCGQRFWGRPTDDAKRNAVRLIQGVKNVSRNRGAESGVSYGSSDLVLQYMYAEMINTGGGCREPEVLDKLAHFTQSQRLPSLDDSSLQNRMTPYLA